MTARKKVSVAKTAVGRVYEKAARTYRLSPGRIEEARKILGVGTATAAIETALDMVIFGAELRGGVAALRRMHFEDVE